MLKKARGDFQTPLALAQRLLALLPETPNHIIEPTCGVGAFLQAAQQQFPECILYGVEINPEYATQAQSHTPHASIVQGDFFHFDWQAFIPKTDNLWIIGNPPWVTNAELGSLYSQNLPQKANYSAEKGLQALLGKSNFDISEAMIQSCLTWVQDKTGGLAMICKTHVARKILLSLWQKNNTAYQASVYLLDAKRYFAAATDACFFILYKSGNNNAHFYCPVLDLDNKDHAKKWAYSHGKLVADFENYQKAILIEGIGEKWRSGIKHDCSAVFELALDQGIYTNNNDEIVNIEKEYLYPLLKSSDVANDYPISRIVIIPQGKIGEDTLSLKNTAPKLWAYLNHYANILAARKSSIYEGKPPFSIFGIGDYSFAPYKIAISGLYKKIHFRLIRPHNNQPVMVDDTVYFLPFWNLAEAKKCWDYLQSQAVSDYLESVIFWDEKRPITAEKLGRIALPMLKKSEAQAELLF